MRHTQGSNNTLMQMHTSNDDHKSMRIAGDFHLDTQRRAHREQTYIASAKCAYGKKKKNGGIQALYYSC
jgi:hypothetical protein